MRKIKASTMVPGQSYHFALYGDRNKVIPCTLLSRPETQIGLMEDSDRFVVRREDNGEDISFRRNACYPYYLVTDVPGKRDGSVVLERVVFFGPDLEPKEPGKRGPKTKVEMVKEVADKHDLQVVEMSLVEPETAPVVADVVPDEKVEVEDTFNPNQLPAGKVRISYYKARKEGNTEEMMRIRAENGF